MQLRAGRVYLGSWIQRDESHGGKAWQQLGMVARGKGKSSYLKLQKLEMMGGGIKLLKPSSNVLLTRPYILSYYKWPSTEDQMWTIGYIPIQTTTVILCIIAITSVFMTLENILIFYLEYTSGNSSPFHILVVTIKTAF